MKRDADGRALFSNGRYRSVRLLGMVGKFSRFRGCLGMRGLWTGSARRVAPNCGHQDSLYSSSTASHADTSVEVNARSPHWECSLAGVPN